MSVQKIWVPNQGCRLHKTEKEYICLIILVWFSFLKLILLCAREMSFYLKPLVVISWVCVDFVVELCVHLNWEWNSLGIFGWFHWARLVARSSVPYAAMLAARKTFSYCENRNNAGDYGNNESQAKKRMY